MNVRDERKLQGGRGGEANIINHINKILDPLFSILNRFNSAKKQRHTTVPLKVLSNENRGGLKLV